jgi:phosphoglycolate phosphatase
MKKMIIFDMDGTLVDSSDMIVASINFVRNEIGLEKLEKEIIISKINNPDIDTNKFFYNDIYFDEKLTNSCNIFYEKNCTQNIQLFDGVKELLEILVKEYILDIATNTYTDLAKKMLQHLNIQTHFSNIIGYEKVEHIKPSADILDFSLNSHNLQPCEAIFIGDSKKDELCANNANIDFIMVDWEKDTSKIILEKIRKYK